MFGGTFDPVHNGHLAIARQARAATGAEGVWFVPGALAPLRDAPQASLGTGSSSCKRRAPDRRVGTTVLDIAIRRGGLSYTADVMDALRAEHPDRDFRVLLGADVARTISAWHRAADLLSGESFVIVNRSGVPQLDADEAELLGYSPARTTLLTCSRRRSAPPRSAPAAPEAASPSMAWSRRRWPPSSRRKGCTGRIETMHNANRMTSRIWPASSPQQQLDKKARDVVVLDIRGKTTIADYFVICEGDTDRQVRAITDNITTSASPGAGLAVAGLKDASWACADFDAVIAHVFLPGERTFYDLEGCGAIPRATATDLTVAAARLAIRRTVVAGG